MVFGGAYLYTPLYGLTHPRTALKTHVISEVCHDSFIRS